MIDLPRRRRFVAQSDAAELRRRGNVSFDEGRRNLKSADDVVESVAGVIGWEICRRIDIQTKQVANGIRVFSAIEAMNFWSPEFRFCRCRSIEFGFQR